MPENRYTLPPSWPLPARLFDRIDRAKWPDRDTGYKPAMHQVTVEVEEGLWLLAAWLQFRLDMRDAADKQGFGTDTPPTDEEFEALTPEQISSYARTYIERLPHDALLLENMNLQSGHHLLRFPLIRNAVLDKARAENKAKAS